MAEKKYCIKTETLAGFAKALGHPARIAIMKFLAKQNTCYFCDIHEELPIAKATVSQHLSALKDAGLIQGEIETPKVKYSVAELRIRRSIKNEGASNCLKPADQALWNPSGDQRPQFLGE